MGRHRVSQMKLAEVLGVAQTGVSKRLRGVIAFDVNELAVLAEFFGIEPAALVSGHPDSPFEKPKRRRAINTGFLREGLRTRTVPAFA